MRTRWCGVGLGLIVSVFGGAVTAQNYMLAQFAQHATVPIPASSGLARFTLSPTAMRASRHAGYADIGMFNEAGEPVPFALIYAEPVKNALPRQIALLPTHVELQGLRKSGVPGHPMSTTQLNGIVIERIRGQATLRVTVNDAAAVVTPPPAPDTYTRSYAVYGEPIAATSVVFDIAAAERDFAVPVRVETSDDLVNWALVSEGTIYRVQVGDSVRESLRLPARGSQVRFARVTFNSDEAFVKRALQGIVMEEVAHAPAPPAEIVTVPMRAGAQAGQWIADLGGRFSVIDMQLSLPQLNTIASTQWSARGTSDAAWQSIANQTVYRMLSKQIEIRNPEIAVAMQPMREVMVQADQRGGGLGNGEVSLHARYHPVEVVFAARGSGPFTLGIGLNAKSVATAALPIASIVPGWSQQARAEITNVVVGAMRENANIKAISSAPWQHVDTRKLILWGVLLLAVGGLGAMAYRLTRK